MAPWWYLLLWAPRRVERRMAELQRRGIIETAPTPWQVWMGVLYMWTRVLRRAETIGVSSSDPVRDTPGARRLERRLVRAASVLRGRVVNPLDQTGLGSSNEHIMRHLLGAYHPGDNALYDLYLLDVEPHAVRDLRVQVQAVVDGSHPRAEHLRDLCVYEGYHERLLELVEAWLRDGPPDQPPSHPDTTLPAFLTWCARQPRGPAATATGWLKGEVTWMP